MSTTVRYGALANLKDTGASSPLSLSVLTTTQVNQIVEEATQAFGLSIVEKVP